MGMKYTTLKEHHLYNKTFQRGKRYSGRYLSVFVLRDLAAKRLMKENPEKRYYNRFGVSVTKKVGGAVQRSRAKRILRAGYRAVEPELKTGFLVVVSPRDGILEAKSTDVERELRRGFSRLAMFRETESK
jgi:ribonuclease P protein component